MAEKQRKSIISKYKTTSLKNSGGFTGDAYEKEYGPVTIQGTERLKCLFCDSNTDEEYAAYGKLATTLHRAFIDNNNDIFIEIALKQTEDGKDYLSLVDVQA